MPVADRFKPFGTTIFAEITNRAVAAKAVNLGQGFPDFDGPEFIKLAAHRAIDTKPNQYAPMGGIPDLTKAIADRWKTSTGLEIDPSVQVTVTAGCTQAIPACTLGLLNPGDEVIVFEPYYDSYPACLAMAAATPVFVTLHDKGGEFAFDEAELRAAVTPKTRAIILNTPHNPTGKVFSRSELEQIAVVCREHDLLCISDEVYDRLVYRDAHNPEAEHVSIASLPDMAERTITLNSLGKTFSLTGWKIGWAIASPELTKGIRAAHQYLTYAVNTPMQHAAAEALGAPDSYYEELIATFAQRRDALAEALERLGFKVNRPAGGYFILADHRGVSGPLGLTTDVEVCHHLIEHAGVATIPPTAFYDHKQRGEHLLRFAFCKTQKTIDAAVERLEKLAKAGV